jgi:hypothetical protein
MATTETEKPVMGGDSSDWRETAYRESYEKELAGLRRRLASESSCTVDDLEGTLKNLYIMDGADWLGRGEVQSISLAAVIAAYETLVEELKKKQ